VKPPGATIRGIGHALDEARFLKPVDDARERDRLDIEHVRKLDLPKARLPVQPEQHLPLRARNPEPDRPPVEGLAQGMRRLTDLKWERFHLFRFPLRRETDIVSLLILSNS
jgi:hypothetical protein